MVKGIKGYMLFHGRSVAELRSITCHMG